MNPPPSLRPLLDTLRPADHAALRSVLHERGPALLVVRGPRGAGVSTVVRGALPPEPRAVWHTASPVADGDQRALLAARLPGGGGSPEADPPDWTDLLEGLRARIDAAREPTILVLDDAHHLLAARSRLPGILADFWSGVRARALPLHLVLAGRPSDGLDALATDGPLAETVALDLALGPVPFRQATDRFRGWPTRDRLLGWSVFGGWPPALDRVDVGVSLATNVRRLVLDADAPFLRHGSDLLERELQSPARYGSILRALAVGRREWGELVEAVPDFGSAGQLAPYLARMEAMGWIDVERSVDAPPRSRSRRYAIADPLLAFWFRYVPPHRAELEAGEGASVWSRSVRPDLERHMALRFGRLCRAWLLEHGDELLPGSAREAGGLWSADHDLEVAGTLRTGAACYGRCLWSDAPAGLEVLREIDRAVAATRYGFGRESRVRLVFSVGGFDVELQRRAAREPPVRLVGADDLLGR